jgi:nuclear transport factor 2 (NTF2) superfamily protein
MEEEAERWMRMINDRLVEAVQTLERERVAIEIVFREHDDGGDWLVWVMVQGEGGASIDESPFAIDRDHAAFAERVKFPNRPEAEPQVLLLAEPVRDAVLRWALRE